ncbi:D-alanyl-D-alanine endopeptidase (penicillin-binding protein 7) [Chitinivorax tropicus]|uniref:D-alanyl-D-alanine endopeptidase (Penicillin-binding protein 7) n=1 Tax=Chitinivorax tropicus TaxID=714531 RepID=A0A840MR51_9PROT|nr:D-alanyl-D-alanine endopeptidase [Chitinivorax tropicus]MBB5019262.1 D-alanyl-D-alanine endopeptidase (penicillin-binding protein 7) [Chitinivorax tropicus]
MTALISALLAFSLAMPEAAVAAAKPKSKQAVQKSAKSARVLAQRAAASKKAAARKAHYSTKTSRKGATKYATSASRSAFKRVVAHEPFKYKLQTYDVVPEALLLASNAAVVFNENNGEVLFSKNNQAPMPIASITKLMTAMVTLDAKLPMDELVTIDEADVDKLKNTSSRLQVGTTLTRAELLLLALMSSENRAAAALGRTYPGGIHAFVNKMNAKANAIGMKHALFYDSTGLNSGNVASAADLVMMVQAAYDYPEIRRYSTTPEYEVFLPSGRRLAYNNTNALVKEDEWQIGLSKTGFLSEAGKCLVMQATISNTPLVIVLLDSVGKYTRLADANRIKAWLEKGGGAKMLYVRS